jgi:transposase
MQHIAFDAHKHYTLASVARPDGQLVREERIEHVRVALQEFLARCERGSPGAVETIGNWYWIVDEIEAAGCVTKLVHARKAKLMMGEINKTDRLDVRGLNRLQRNGTLPTVWIPPGEVRDQRDLPRTRMVLIRQRTQLENRIHATLAKYALHDHEGSDVFGTRGRDLLRQRFALLPPHTAYASQQLLEQIGSLDRQVRELEHRIRATFKPTPPIQRLLTVPGIGLTLAVVIALEVGEQAWHVVGEIESALASQGNGADREPPVLTLQQAASLLQTTTDSLQRRWSGLPFMYKCPVDGRLKAERTGLERWVRDRGK